ncbi:M64 family metallopeptidase [Rhabdaerophilum sp. SD176]|uniref:M64 family metallopeptidase n=1 Tax=Rhabdaerophilum sp. SD176 TaxID=2983548 RepID=UPI0024E03034|nr:M64 family metallopeptidase [Rhabdaerophilum sp. SD176]
MAVRTIVNTGAASNRIDMIFLGDGYTAGEIATTYTNHAQSLVNYLFNDSILSQPFGRYEKFFNIHLVDVVSAQSGADDPASGTVRDTALGATYNFDGATDRLLYINDTTAGSVMNAALSGTGIAADMRFVTVNETKYGGGGGYFATYAGGNPEALEIALHEVGHSFVGLADEYGGITSRYTGAEPAEVNITTDPTGAKWSHWMGYEQAGISQYLRPDLVGQIGVYEGGGYYEQGIYRPSELSKMRVLNQPFDAVSREAFVLEFYKYVDPLDSYAYQGQAAVTDIPLLSVTPVDSEIIKVDWFVNGVLTRSNATQATMSELGLGVGTFTVSARAYDTTDWVRLDRFSLEQTVNWTVTLTRAPNYTTPGNDVFRSTSASETFDGAAGRDTVIFQSTRAEYSLGTIGTDWLVTDQTISRDGIDRLTAIERLQFSDGTLAIDTPGNAGQVYRLYQAAFARTPDTPGLKHNVGLVDGGLTIQEMASAFIASAEFDQKYGADPSDSSYITALYQNVLGRAPDPSGFSGWQGRLDDGSWTRTTMLLGFSESPENISNVANAIANGIWLG